VSDTQNNSSAQLHIGANDNTNQKKLRHRQWGGATVGLLLGLVGLVAGRLGQLYPHFDVFAQFTVQFMACVAGFAIAIFFARFKTLIGVTLTLALLALYGAWPHFVSTSMEKVPVVVQSGEQSMRIAHFNSYKLNFDYAAIANEILRLDADVVSLVEISPQKLAAILPKLQTSYPHNYNCTAQHCDLAILSKYPILNSEGNGIWEGAPYIRVSLGGKMTGVNIVGVHTTRFPQSRAQLKQIQALVLKLESVTGDMIVLGDFNATPYSRITKTLEQGANIKRLTDLPTWPTHLQLPQLAIDHAFASGNFRVVGKQQIGEAVGSDHYPIVLTLVRKTTP
jgi:endonuclease/exonuclease/phosphatase (EEP) superfamily protein YafD